MTTDVPRGSAIGAGTSLGSVRVDRFIGEGSVGWVWQGHHVGLGIDVAVKVLKPESPQSFHAFRERFRQEARLAARIDHRAVVRVLDCGEYEGSAYLVMEYVDGQSLETWMRRHPGAIDENIGLRILAVIASGLAAAHAANVIHRDLKPSNVLIDRRGRMKIADFGLARDSDGAELTQQRVSVGSPGYMAPETLLSGQRVDFRADLYALGVIAYLFAFRRLPYSGTISQIVHGHIAGTARFDLPTTWSADAVALIRALMAPEREDRPRTASVVLRRLRSLTTGESTASAEPSGEHAAVRSEVGDGNDTARVGHSESSTIARFFEQQLGEHATVVDGTRVVHTSRNERRVVWLILLGLFGVALVGYLVSSPA